MQIYCYSRVKYSARIKFHVYHNGVSLPLGSSILVTTNPLSTTSLDVSMSEVMVQCHMNPFLSIYVCIHVTTLTFTRRKLCIFD